MNNRKKNLFKLFSIAFFFLVSLGFTPKPDSHSESINLENLARELIINDVEHWIVVMSQGIVEAGWQFNSPLFKRTNNFIGMRIPGNRESMRVGEHKGYSVYATWQDCVKDIKLWQQKSWKGGTKEQYIDLMQSRWAESPEYKQALHSVIKKLDRMFDKMVSNQEDHFNHTIIKAYLASKQ